MISKEQLIKQLEDESKNLTIEFGLEYVPSLMRDAVKELKNKSEKVYIIQELVFNEASGALYSNGTVVLGDKEKAFNRFKKCVAFYGKQSEYYEKIIDTEEFVELSGGGDIETVKIKISELEPVDGMANFSI